MLDFTLLILSLLSLADAFNVTFKVGDPAVLFYADSGNLTSKSSLLNDLKGYLSFLEASEQLKDDEFPVS
jgi:hypothetical protein